MDINFYNVYLNVALFGKPQAQVYYPNIYPGLVDTSGVMVMNYDGFVSTNAGAKDTWGINFFQIEGEKGYIYVEGGSNSFNQIRVVTKTTEEVLNEQPEEDRRFFEVQQVTRYLLEGNKQALEQRLQTMLAVMETLEDARKAAGIFFPGD
jgi:predicted dehydrogenase